ncbi:hypothetical protein [Mycolicibacterium smegmatis]|nr:hypothetical protein [Mycolicibacterium smegmatis]
MSELPYLSAGFAAGCPIARLVLGLHIGLRPTTTTDEETHDD